MKMIKNIFAHSVVIAAMLACIPQSGGIAAQNNVIDEVVWVVGDAAIYKSEVEEVRQEAQRHGTRWEGDPYCIIPEQLAVNKLFMNQAELDSITADAADVNQYVEESYKELVDDAGSEEKLEEYRGMTSAQIKERLYESIYQELVVEKVRAKITERVKVTPADVRRYLKDVPEDEILSRAYNQNFVPVVDDRDVFIGIIKRRDIIKYLAGVQTEIKE